jgi:hypothetical protein
LIKDLEGNTREVDPVLMALYNFINNSLEMLKETKSAKFCDRIIILDEDGQIVNVYDKPTLENNISHGKSIFKKLDPDTFGFFFEEENLDKKAS